MEYLQYGQIYNLDKEWKTVFQKIVERSMNLLCEVEMWKSSTNVYLLIKRPTYKRYIKQQTYWGWEPSKDSVGSLQRFSGSIQSDIAGSESVNVAY